MPLATTECSYKSTVKPRKNKVNATRTLKKLRGGLVYGSGTFGAILGDPSVPFKLPRLLGSKKSQTNESRSKTLHSKTQQSKTLHSKKQLNPAKINPRNYVSKLFYDPDDIEDVNKVMELLKNAVGSKVTQVFDRYLLLPINIPLLGYELNIDKDMYSTDKFQSDKYWTMLRDGKVDTKSRENLRDANTQVLYPKALSDMSEVKLSNHAEFIMFLEKFRNVVAGIQVLHKHGLVHHDLKPPNTLVLGSKTDIRKQHYKISDLDSMQNVNNFTNESEDQVSRLFNNWGYDYFPTCSTLIASTLAAKSSGTSRAQINGAVANTWISHGMERNKEDPYTNTFNQNSSTYIQKDMQVFIRHIKRVLPDKASELSSILLDINRSKFGTIQLDDDNLSDGGAGFNAPKYKVLTDINSKIAGILNSDRNLSLDDKHNILVKYVDIYSLGQSLLEMTKNYITAAHGVFDEAAAHKIIDVFDFAFNLLTNAYFDQEIYNNDILSVYDESVLGKSSGLVASSRSKSSSNSSVKMDAIFQ